MRRQVLLATIRVLAWFSLAAIVVLSVVPLGLRPHVMTDKHHEHFFAYLASGCCYALGYQRPPHMLATGVMLTVVSAVLEVIQHWIPGRTPGLGDWLASSLGAWCGIALVCVGLRALHRATAVHQPE